MKIWSNKLLLNSISIMTVVGILFFSLQNSSYYDGQTVYATVYENIYNSPIPPDMLSVTIIEATSDGTYLNQKIEEMIEAGKTNFLIKSGTYYLNDSIIIDQPNIRIEGESKENTILVQTNVHSRSIVVKADNVNVSKLTIDNKANGGNIAFVQENSNDVTLEDCIIYGSNTNEAVLFQGKKIDGGTEDYSAVENNNSLNSNNSIQNNIIYSQASGGDAIHFSRQNNGKIDNNHVFGNQIAFYLSRNSEVTNNMIRDSEKNGIRYAVPAHDNVISNNSIKNSKASGIFATRLDQTLISEDYRGRGLIIKNNQIENARYFGLEINNLEGATISNNEINNTDFSGIYLLRSDNISITNNRIINSGRTTVNGKLWDWNEELNSGIFVEYKVRNCSIADNEIINTENMCYYPIRIQNGNENNGNRIVDNTVKGSFLNELSLTGNEHEVKDNELYIIPQNIKAEPSLYAIALSWDAIEGGFHYQIELGTQPPLDTLDNGTFSKYDHIHLSPNTNYSYRVRFIEGLWSEVIIGTTLAEPPIDPPADPSPTEPPIDTPADPSPTEPPIDPPAEPNPTEPPIDTPADPSPTEPPIDTPADPSPTEPPIDTPADPSPTEPPIDTPENVSGDKGEKVSTVELPSSVSVGSPHKREILKFIPILGFVKKGKGSEYLEERESLLRPPANIKVIVGDNQHIITWDAVEGAVGYEIEINENVVEVGAETNYVHLDLSLGSVYSYRVRAQNGLWSHKITVKAIKKASPQIEEELSMISNRSVKEEKISYDSEIIVPQQSNEDIHAAHNKENHPKEREKTFHAKVYLLILILLMIILIMRRYQKMSKIAGLDSASDVNKRLLTLAGDFQKLIQLLKKDM